jgi:hypothetical protein
MNDKWEDHQQIISFQSVRRVVMMLWGTVELQGGSVHNSIPYFSFCETLLQVTAHVFPSNGAFTLVYFQSSLLTDKSLAAPPSEEGGCRAQRTPVTILPTVSRILQGRKVW